MVPSILLLKRPAILTPKQHANMSYREIAEKLKLKKSTVEDIVWKVKAVIDNKYQAFHDKLQRVILHGGNNNFNGQWTLDIQIYDGYLSAILNLRTGLLD